MTDRDVIRGEADPEADRWLDLAETDLGPAKSLERIEATSAAVLGRVALVATALTGLGVLALTLDQVLRYRTAILFVFGLVALAVLTAAGASFRGLRFLSANQPDQVRRFYRWNVVWRGAFATFAQVAMLAAVGVALVTAAHAFAYAHPVTDLHLGWHQAGAADQLSVTAQGHRLAPGTSLRVRLVGLGEEGDETLVAERSAAATESGSVELTFDVESAEQYHRYRASMSSDGAAGTPIDGEAAVTPERPAPGVPHVVLQLVGPAGEQQLHLDVASVGLPDRATATSSVTAAGCAGAQGPQMTLFRQAATLGTAGTLQISKHTAIKHPCRSYRATVLVEHDGITIVDEIVDLETP